MKMHIEIEVDVNYHYQPFEKATLEYPGCDAEITLESVLFGGINIEPFLDAKTRDGIRHECECDVSPDAKVRRAFGPDLEEAAQGLMNLSIRVQQ